MKKDIEKSILVFAVSAGVVYVGYHCYQYLKERQLRAKYIQVPYPVEEKTKADDIQKVKQM